MFLKYSLSFLQFKGLTKFHNLSKSFVRFAIYSYIYLVWQIALQSMICQMFQALLGIKLFGHWFSAIYLDLQLAYRWEWILMEMGLIISQKSDKTQPPPNSIKISMSLGWDVYVFGSHLFMKYKFKSKLT